MKILNRFGLARKSDLDAARQQIEGLKSTIETANKILLEKTGLSLQEHLWIELETANPWRVMRITNISVPEGY